MKPFRRKDYNFLEKSVEALFMILIYHMVVFTDFVLDEAVHYQFGHYFLATFGLIAMANFIVLSVNAVSGIRQKQIIS